MLVYVGVLCILFFLYGMGFRYKNDILSGVNRKEYKFYFLFSMSAFWLDRTRYFYRETAKSKLELYRKLHPGKNAKRVYYLESYHKISIVYSILFLFCVLCLILKATNHVITTSEYMIKRPVVGGQVQEEQLLVTLSQGENVMQEQITIEVPGREYSEEELTQYKNLAENYVLSSIKGSNLSLENVKADLNLVTEVPENPFQVTWYLMGQDYINEDGTINNKKIKEKVYVTIKACLVYQDSEQYIEIPVGITPYEWSWEEKAKEEFLNAVEQINTENSTEETFQLPAEIEDIQVNYEENTPDKSKKLILCAMLCCVSLYVYWEESLKAKNKRYVEECQRVYPEIVYKLTLLLGAGMTFRGAWRKMVSDYMRGKEDNKNSMCLVYEEMIITWNEMENGVSESDSFAMFGKRMKQRSYLRLSSLVTQNMKKGTQGFLQQLEAEAKEAQEERKQLAKKLGEEASSKLLFPMLIMLVIVLAIVMIPAFLSFSEGGL